eukprot:scaffold37179_cov17-Tisochrysis_lutea.AAC.1
MNVSTCIAINKGWVSSRKEELQEGHSQLSHKTSPRSSIDLSTDMICLEGQGGKNFKSMACKAVLALLLPAFRIIHKEKELKPSVVSTCQMQPAITAMTRGHHVADLITVSLSCSWAAATCTDSRPGKEGQEGRPPHLAHPASSPPRF